MDRHPVLPGEPCYPFFMIAIPRVHPITFRPIFKEKVWGRRNLSRFGKVLPESGKIGESWELVDLASTSPGGGGGDAARSLIDNGLLAGSTLHEAMGTWGDRLMGSLPRSADDGFPLLVKYLDAGENLSVQVHPSSEYVAAHRSTHLKTESWYILDAEPGAVIYKGLKPGVDRRALADAVEQGRVAELLQAVPVSAGDCHDLPSGTVHALGAGITLVEVQTASDTTFRLYDWSDLYQHRPQRELHVEQALECASFEPVLPAARLPEGERRGRLIRNSFYDIWELRLREGDAAGHPEPGNTCHVLMILEGELASGCDRFPAGSTILVPAASRGSLRSETEARVLAIGFTREPAPGPVR
jgi:mannose-6-phosphate isomerase